MLRMLQLSSKCVCMWWGIKLDWIRYVIEQEFPPVYPWTTSWTKSCFA